MGRFEEGRQAAQGSLRLEPGNALAAGNLAWSGRGLMKAGLDLTAAGDSAAALELSHRSEDSASERFTPLKLIWASQMENSTMARKRIDILRGQFYSPRSHRSLSSISPAGSVRAGAFLRR
jgi:hypothetical protein